MKNTIKFITLFLLVLTFNSCQDFETDLEVANDQDPSSKQLGIDATANKIFQNWYQSVNSYNGPGLALLTMSDMNTCSWGNRGMKDLSSEPRVAFDNRAEYGNAIITYNYFNSLNSILTDSNGLMNSIKNGNPFEDAKRTEAIAKFGQAVSIGYMALVFDRVWVSDEEGTKNNGEALNYKEAMKFALTKLDEAIQIANNNSFEIPKEFTNTRSLSNTDFSEFLNSIGARLMTNNVRNASQRDALDWNKVLNYATNGLKSDFKVAGDGWENWGNDVAFVSLFGAWNRTDMRVINLMDKSFPAYWDETVNNLAEAPKATSKDKRLESDFSYKQSNNFKPDRGIYHFSSYKHTRYSSYAAEGYVSEFPEFLKAENNLYLAEAQLRLGMLADAAATINAGPRVTRGGLSPIAANETEIAEAIHYERSIELLTTAMGLEFFEMRRNNLLQKGTLLHFPVPGAALNAAGLNLYTFGGTTGVAGEDYSNGGWR